MLELQSVTAGYTGREVLHGVSAVIPDRQLTVLIGPNGCGKSTLLRVLAGQLCPEGGAVLLDGKTLADYAPRELARRIAFLPQTRAVPELSVRQLVLHGRFPYLGMPRRYRAEDHAAVDAALEQMELTALQTRQLRTLSGGERQRAYLAMALAQDTQTVLLDEPASFLDIRHQLEVCEMARRLCALGKTVVMVTHELTQGLDCADQVCLLAAGHLLRQTTPDALDAAAVRDAFGVHAERIEGVWRFRLA